MNQDAILALPEERTFVVADGMGGEKAGEEASARAIETLEKECDRWREQPPESPEEMLMRLREALLQANRDVYRIATEQPEKRGLGTTASLLFFHRGLFFCAHVGDSRIYLQRGGRLRQLTRDHTLVWAMYERGALAREQLDTHPDRHLLTQCVGSPRTITVDVFASRVQPGDRFLICSDGLSGYVAEGRIAAIMQEQAAGPEVLAEELVQAALDGGGGDNISAVVVEIDALDESDDWHMPRPQQPVPVSESEGKSRDLDTESAATEPDVATGAGDATTASRRPCGPAACSILHRCRRSITRCAGRSGSSRR